MRPDGEPKGYRIGNRIDATKRAWSIEAQKLEIKKSKYTLEDILVIPVVWA